MCFTDTILIKGVDRKKMVVAKLLVQLLYVKLHKDMMKSQADGGFASSSNASGKILISDATLKLNRPRYMKPMINRHKQMSSYQPCIVSKLLLLTLTQ